MLCARSIPKLLPWRVPSPNLRDVDRSTFWPAALEGASLRYCCVLTIAATVATVVASASEPAPFRAARSVHLSYPSPAGAFFYNEVVVERSVNGSYFMACGWNTGYFGIQQLDGPDDKVVLFSVWDPTKGDDPAAVSAEDRVEVLAQAADVRIKRFGGEGTGGQCMWKHSWLVGQTNRFLIGAESQNGKCAYTAWFWTEPGWKKLATFRTRASVPMSGFYSFIEDFRRDGKSVFDSRRARFGNGWLQGVDGKWLALANARFTASNAEWESKENIDSGVERGEFFLETGGRIKMSRELKSMIRLPEVPATPPRDLLDFVSSLAEAKQTR
jgi:Domain of unknown function (DUF3472)/Domain of unknown function (DUF5077)